MIVEIIKSDNSLTIIKTIHRMMSKILDAHNTSLIAVLRFSQVKILLKFFNLKNILTKIIN